MGKLRQTTEEIQDILDKVQNGEVGEKIVVDSMLSTESENPVMNKVITEELGKKVEALSGIIETIDNPRDYIDDVGENLYIPLSINDSAATKIIVYFQPNGESVGTLLLNQENNYVDEKWNESGDYCYHAEYANGILRLEEINNFSLDFIRVEVYDIKAIDESLIPNSIARKKEVEDATGKIEEHVDELREETTALWENLEHGTFPDLVAGDLVGHGESVPAEFTFRASGGKSIKDGRAYIKRIKGNSVVWNNMVDSRGYDGAFFVDVPPPIIQGHKYLLKRTHATNGLYLIPIINGEEKYEVSIQNGVYAAILESPHTGDASRVYSESYSGACVISDLTKTFGAGNEPSTIEEYEARKPIVEDEFAYNEGEVIHTTAEGIKSVGDNAWDEQWEIGSINAANGELGDNTSYFRSTNYNRMMGGEEYTLLLTYDAAVIVLYDEDYQYIDYWNIYTSAPRTILTDERTRYFKVSAQGRYDGGIMVRLTHSGWKDEVEPTYQPYWEDTLPLPIISNYFPNGMKKAGSAYDEVRFNKASGKWEAVQRIGSVRVADYVRRDAEGVFILSNLPKKPANNINGEYSTNVLMAGYASDLGAYSYEVKSEARIAVARDTIWLNAENLKQYASTQEYIDAIGDTKVFYELAEPIVTEITENFRDFYKVADFGTEELLTSMPSAPFKADIIYQFNAVDMIREHELEITELQNVIATMQAQLASLTNN
jgi:hypothetical protein